MKGNGETLKDMSRSYKRNNYTGYASDSDKSWKQSYNRKSRRRNGHDLNAQDDFDDYPREQKLYGCSDVWTSNKDGKCYLPRNPGKGGDSRFNKQGKLRK